FFYSWSEFSASLPKADCVRAGLVVERTQASGHTDVRRGPLVGFKHKCKDKAVDLTIYWLAPGSREATFVFAVTVEFCTMILFMIFPTDPAPKTTEVRATNH